MENKEEIIYNVTVDWARDLEGSIMTESFRKLDDARKYFNEQVKESKGYDGFDCDTGKVLDGYVQEEYMAEDKTFWSWEIWLEGEYDVRHTSITLSEKVLR